MEVDKSRAALTSGETPLLLCGGEAELASRAALTSGETPLPLCSRAPPAPIFARWPLDFFHRFLISFKVIDWEKCTRKGRLRLVGRWRKVEKMYALTVNDIDAQTYARINCIAIEEELPLSQVLHRLLQSALEKYPFRRKSDFSRFAGRWSSAEAKEFEAATQRTIDEEDWQ